MRPVVATVPTFFSPEEAAPQLGVSRSSVYRLCARGALAHIRPLGARGRIKIRAEDIAAFLDRQRHAAHPAARRPQPAPARDPLAGGVMYGGRRKRSA